MSGTNSVVLQRHFRRRESMQKMMKNDAEDWEERLEKVRGSQRWVGRTSPFDPRPPSSGPDPAHRPLRLKAHRRCPLRKVSQAHHFRFHNTKNIQAKRGAETHLGFPAWHTALPPTSWLSSPCRPAPQGWLGWFELKCCNKPNTIRKDDLLPDNLT